MTSSPFMTRRASAGGWKDAQRGAREPQATECKRLSQERGASRQDAGEPGRLYGSTEYAGILGQIRLGHFVMGSVQEGGLGAGYPNS